MLFYNKNHIILKNYSTNLLKNLSDDNTQFPLQAEDFLVQNFFENTRIMHDNIWYFITKIELFSTTTQPIKFKIYQIKQHSFTFQTDEFSVQNSFEITRIKCGNICCQTDKFSVHNYLEITRIKVGNIWYFITKVILFSKTIQRIYSKIYQMTVLSFLYKLKTFQSKTSLKTRK